MSKKISYKLIYIEDGKRKEELFEFEGAPTGKKCKEWQESVMIQSQKIWMQPDCHLVGSVWTGLGKKRGRK